MLQRPSAALLLGLVAWTGAVATVTAQTPLPSTPRDSAHALFMRGAEIADRQREPVVSLLTGAAFGGSQLNQQEAAEVLGLWTRAAELYEAAGAVGPLIRLHARRGAFFERLEMADSARGAYEHARALAATAGDRYSEMELAQHLMELLLDGSSSTVDVWQMATLQQRLATLTEESDPQSADLGERLLELADVMTWLEPDSALRVLQRLATVQPTQHVARRHMAEARAHAERRDTSAAALAYRHARDAAVSAADYDGAERAAGELISLLLDAGRGRDALTELPAAIDLNAVRVQHCELICLPWTAIPLERLAVTYLELGEPDSAVAMAAMAFAAGFRPPPGVPAQEALDEELGRIAPPLYDYYDQLAEARHDGDGRLEVDALQALAIHHEWFGLRILAERQYGEALEALQDRTAREEWTSETEDVEILWQLAELLAESFAADSAATLLAHGRSLMEARGLEPSAAYGAAYARALARSVDPRTQQSMPRDLEATTAAYAEAIRSAHRDGEHELGAALDREWKELVVRAALVRAGEPGALPRLAEAAALAEDLGERELQQQVTSLLMTELAVEALQPIAGHTDLEWLRSTLPATQEMATLLRGSPIAEFLQPMMIARIGVIHARLGQGDSALFYGRRAVEITRRAAVANSIDDSLSPAVLAAPAAYLMLAQTHLILGRPDSALVALNTAQIDARLLDEGTHLDALLFTTGSEILARLGRSAEALSQARHALPRTAGELFGPDAAGALALIGRAYVVADRPSLGLTFLRQALAPYEALPLNVGEDALILADMGVAHRQLGQLDSAALYLERSLTAARAGPSGLRSYEYRPLLELAALSIEAGAPGPAVQYAQRARDITLLQNDLHLEAAALQMLAAAHRSTGTTQGRTAALAAYDTAGGIIARLAARAGSDENRVAYNELQTRHVASWALTWLGGQAGSAAERNRNALAALAAAERGRGQALLQLAQGAAADMTDWLSADAVVEEGPTLAAVAELEGPVLSYLVTSDTLIVWLVKGRDDVLVHRTAVADTALARLVATLRATLGVESDAREALRLEPTSTGDRSVIVGAGAAGDWRRAGALLADLLLPLPIRSRISSGDPLLIVTSGVIGMVPFTMLPLDSAGTPLGVHTAVRYTPSLRLLQQRANEPRAELRGEVLVVGDPGMPAVPTGVEWVELTQLEGAGSEAEWIARQFGTTPLVGAMATESEVRRLMPQRRILHFATHGFAYSSEHNARRSFVALAPDAAHDGLLTVGEILDDPTLRFDNTELVVLSACQTGLGYLQQSEGTVGLQRAFLAKGARSVLVSLWNVSDAATEILMRHYYQHLLDETAPKTKAEALRLAQEDLRREGYVHPRYWAAFQLVGAN